MYILIAGFEVTELYFLVLLKYTGCCLLCRRMSKGVEYLVEASAAEAEAISATLAAAKARQVNGEVELPDRDRGSEATPSGKQISTLIKPDSAGSNNIPSAGVRLHHRAVSIRF